jgi:hypothetical protein
MALKINALKALETSVAIHQSERNVSEHMNLHRFGSYRKLTLWGTGIANFVQVVYPFLLFFLLSPSTLFIY